MVTRSPSRKLEKRPSFVMWFISGFAVLLDGRLPDHSDELRFEGDSAGLVDASEVLVQRPTAAVDGRHLLSWHTAAWFSGKGGNSSAARAICRGTR